MSELPEVFRFTVVRSPQAVKISEVTELPDVDAIGGASAARKLARDIEAKFLERADASGAIDELVGEHSVSRTLSALLMFGTESKLINLLSREMRRQTPPSSVPGDSALIIPEYHRIPQPPLSEDEPVAPLVKKPHFGPVGIGDLMVVEQHLEKYEAGEVAHIENILASEIRDRQHRHLTEVDITVSEDVEIASFMEQNLQTAERYELQTAAKEEIAQRSSLDVGISVSAKYGPTVKVDSDINYSRENSRQASRERASSFAQEITEQATRRTEERIRTRREDRRRTETEHRNSHRFENNGPDAANITGIYRYVDKVYRVKLVNRGVRLFYEFMIPMPGAYLRHIASKPQRSGLRAPARPTETISSITPENYERTINKYAITGVAPPPSGIVVATETFSDNDSGSEGPQRFLKEGSIPIEDGYAASHAFISIITWRQHQVDPEMVLVIGRKSREFDSLRMTRDTDEILRDAPSDIFEIEGLGLQRGSIGYSFFCKHDSTVQVKIEVVCVPTKDKITEWCHAVYDAIIDDYKAKLSEYEAALAGEESEQEVRFAAGQHPAHLRKLEQDELKRLCLQVFGHESQLADPLYEGGIPFVMEDDEAPLEEGDEKIDLDRLGPLSREMRFGEQAFEWTNMTFTLYPYYWADEGDWEDLIRLQHPDYLHQEFLRAGAARVLVPVRENFDKKVHSLLVHGPKALSFVDDIEITSPYWVPLYQEIEEAQNPSGRNLSVVKCWPTRVPTNLIYLQADAKLPEFDVPADCPND